MFDPRPLCCSSLTTAIGGTTDTNFVDSAHPTVARIKNGVVARDGALVQVRSCETLVILITSLGEFPFIILQSFFLSFI